MAWNKRLAETQSLNKRLQIQMDGKLPTFLGTLRETAFTESMVSFGFLIL